MGGGYSLYGRLKSNDKYQIIHPTIDSDHMARFKHDVYAYALERSHTNMKAIYLYNGYTRVAKAIRPVCSDYLEISFKDQNTATDWDMAEERIRTSEVPWLYRHFAHAFKPIVHDKLHMRIFLYLHVHRTK